LYLHNRYAQYTNALCAAAEIAQINGSFDTGHFSSLPEQFGQFLENELNPTTSIAPDLYPLKQAAQGDPHHEFPLRNGIEKSFRVFTNRGESRGEVSFSQALREAYPGAVYYYTAIPYRVQRFNYRDGEITVCRERRYTTKPIRFAMVFPDFGPSVLRLRSSDAGFLAEAEMQVSERVTGFKEKRGKTETANTYGPGSSYSQQPLTRFIRTTGVCWFFPQPQLVSEALANSTPEVHTASNH
jgi:DEAD/DEAH box helicase domain-containing protein